MISFIAHFDGKNLVLDEPVSLPKDTPLNVQIEVPEEEDEAVIIEQRKKMFGCAKGMIEIGPEFFEPLPPDIEAAFNGETE